MDYGNIGEKSAGKPNLRRGSERIVDGLERFRIIFTAILLPERTAWA